AAVFRGKELDLAYQDFVMREVTARTKPGDRIWGGMIWAMQREPAYRLWFLPDMARHLVRLGYEPPFSVADPPAAVIIDHYAIVWVSTVQPELAHFLMTHYLPVWRKLWVPGLSARVMPHTSMEWIVPADGAYRVIASAPLANHPWFRAPLYCGSYEGDASQCHPLRLPFAEPNPALHWSLDGKPIEGGESLDLR